MEQYSVRHDCWVLLFTGWQALNVARSFRGFSEDFIAITVLQSVSESLIGSHTYAIYSLNCSYLCDGFVSETFVSSSYVGISLLVYVYCFLLLDGSTHTISVITL